MSSKQFDPHYWSLEEMFKHVYNVPVYQRPYSWDIEQVEVLLEDLNSVFMSVSNDKNYFIGNVIIHDKNEKIEGSILKFDIIDGQQRITTFCLILLALYSLACKKGLASSDPTMQKIKGALWKYYKREYNINIRTVSLNSVDKECFSNIYNYCYKADTDSESDSYKYCIDYIKKTKFEERIIDNYLYIYEYLTNSILKDNVDNLLSFADFLLSNAQFIVIEASCRENMVFSIFESINSKGKKLDDIDLFKTYIFSNLDDVDYEYYLNLWGNLTIQTEDNLYDYIYNFIRAYISFYRQKISMKNFKSLCEFELQQYYNKSSLQEALKSFLNDLNNKVKYYNMLSSTEEACKLINNNKMRFYFKVFTEIGYKHPKPLFFRSFVEFSENKITKDTVTSVITETVKFMLEFLTISGRDSKDAITMFSNIMNEIYDKNIILKETVENNIATELLKQSINKENIKQNIVAMDAYEQNRKVAVTLLSLYDSTNDDGHVSYDQAYTLLNSFSDSFSLDHILVQTPDKDNNKYKYYRDDDNDRLVLLDGHDFPLDLVADGMDYTLFTKTVLNRIGNLRIYYRDKNSGRQNNAIELPEYDNFVSYKQIRDRGEKIGDFISDNILVAPEVDISKLQLNNQKKNYDSLPKMDALIEFGAVNIGDELYITISPDDSKARLLNSKYVLYNGKKMTLNEWGCTVTGWKSIRIYAYVAKCGESETLQEKREKIADSYNEESISI